MEFWEAEIEAPEMRARLHQNPSVLWFGRQLLMHDIYRNVSLRVGRAIIAPIIPYGGDFKIQKKSITNSKQLRHKVTPFRATRRLSILSNY